LHKVERIHGYTVLLAPIKALPCLCFFPPMAEKSKPPAPRMVGDSKNGQTQLSPRRPCFFSEASYRRFPPAVFDSFTSLIKSILMIPFNKH
jgi:hypothetical protein